MMLKLSSYINDVGYLFKAYLRGIFMFASKPKKGPNIIFLQLLQGERL